MRSLQRAGGAERVRAARAASGPGSRGDGQSARRFHLQLRGRRFQRGAGSASALQNRYGPPAIGCARASNGSTGFSSIPVLPRAAVAPALEAQALADKAVLYAYPRDAASIESAEQASTIARGLDDPDLLTRCSPPVAPPTPIAPGRQAPTSMRPCPHRRRHRPKARPDAVLASLCSRQRPKVTH